MYFVFDLLDINPIIELYLKLKLNFNPFIFKMLFAGFVSLKEVKNKKISV